MKPFKESKVGKFLFSATGRGLAKSVPIIGPLLGNILNDNNAAPGSIDKEEIKSDVIQVALVALIIAYLMGWISFEQANEAKNLLGQ